jgi:hypothetical protein
MEELTLSADCLEMRCPMSINACHIDLIPFALKLVQCLEYQSREYTSMPIWPCIKRHMAKFQLCLYWQSDFSICLHAKESSLCNYFLDINIKLCLF